MLRISVGQILKSTLCSLLVTSLAPRKFLLANFLIDHFFIFFHSYPYITYHKTSMTLLSTKTLKKVLRAQMLTALTSFAYFAYLHVLHICIFFANFAYFAFPYFTFFACFAYFTYFAYFQTYAPTLDYVFQPARVSSFNFQQGHDIKFQKSISQ